MSNKSSQPVALTWPCVLQVRLCKDKTNNKLYAIKIIKKENMKKGVSSKYYDDVKAEIAIMKKLTHPNVLRLYEVMDDPKVSEPQAGKAVVCMKQQRGRAAALGSWSAS